MFCALCLLYCCDVEDVFGGLLSAGGGELRVLVRQPFQLCWAEEDIE